MWNKLYIVCAFVVVVIYTTNGHAATNPSSQLSSAELKLWKGLGISYHRDVCQHDEDLMIFEKMVEILGINNYIETCKRIILKSLSCELKAWKNLCNTYQMVGCNIKAHIENPCNSPHVQCKHHNNKAVIVGIKLEGRGIYAPMSKALLQFRHLETLDAAKVFSGNIPKWFGRLSPHMKSISMNHNRLEGSIPASLSNLHNLESFEVFEQCSYPKKLERNPHDNGRPCRKMFRVGWDGSDKSNPNEWSCGGLSGTIPSSLQKLTKLRRFWVDENRLTGTLPGWLAKMPNLEQLDLFANPFRGGIPKEWKQKNSFPKLQTLQLGGTYIKAKASSLATMLGVIKHLQEANLRDITISPSPVIFRNLYLSRGFFPGGHILHVIKLCKGTQCKKVEH